ncbi:MAG TPA: BamA/TamA family outer membrane protein [Blastocatellia bacterium]|nr:BamA/TamA family outer membrane protein [Blastocatellia bacterium]
MNRLPKASVVTGVAIAALLVLVGAGFQPCKAQTQDPTVTQPSSKIAASLDQPSNDVSGSTDPAPPPPQATGPAGNPQAHASIADRVKTFNRLAPIHESWTTIDLGTKYVKGVFGGLEQGASIGLGIQLTTADRFKGVEFRATLITSAKLYRRFEGEAYFPKLFSENTHADVWFDYLRRTKDNFFGIGPTVPNTSMTNYDIERRVYSGSIYHNFTRRAVLGGYASLANSSTYRGERTTDIPIDQLFSGDPNVVPITKWAPGLMMNTKILRYGGFGEYDGRDNTRGLTRGGYFYARVGNNEGLDNKGVFSDYQWFEAEVDGRGYIPIGSNKTSLALRAYAQLKNSMDTSQIPFYDMSYLGGRMYVRGFRDYRFRGNNVALASAELRQTVWSQTDTRGLDIFAFGDGGQVWGDNRSQTDPTVLANDKFSSSNYRASVGGGLQYRYNKSLAGRVELGHSHERNLIYFSVTRGF